MEIYIRRNESSDGPYSIEQVQDLIAQGMLRLDDWAQVEGESQWQPLHEIPDVHFKPPPGMHPAFEVPDEAPDAIADGPQVRPWIRYWARTLDTLVFAVGVGAIFAVIAPEAIETRATERLLEFIALILWIPIEAAFISSFGATAGKALLRINVVNPDGSKLSYPQSLKRSFNVWLRGMGIGIPLVSIISMILAYKSLTNSGKTSWDRIGGYRVRHREIGTVRGTIAIIILVALLGLILAGLIAEKALNQ